MALASGDLTTPTRIATWLSTAPSLPSPILSQLIGAVTDLIYGKLNRARTFSQTYTRTLDGTGTYQLVLPDYPVTSIVSVQVGGRLINPAPLPNPVTGVIPPPNFGYGYRFVPWSGELPGDPVVLEFVNGVWPYGVQNIKVTYVAGYLIQNEAWQVPASPGPYVVTVKQPQGIFCKDAGVTYANGTALTSTATIPPPTGSYNPPTDPTAIGNPIGQYTFAPGDTLANLLISYSFIPASLEEACCQEVAERYVYRSRVGEIAKSLGGQESMRYYRGEQAPAYRRMNALPPEVMDFIQPYVSVIPPALGAPV